MHGTSNLRGLAYQLTPSDREKGEDRKGLSRVLVRLSKKNRPRKKRPGGPPDHLKATSSREEKRPWREAAFRLKTKLRMGTSHYFVSLLWLERKCRILMMKTIILISIKTHGKKGGGGGSAVEEPTKGRGSSDGKLSNHSTTTTPGIKYRDYWDEKRKNKKRKPFRFGKKIMSGVL